MAWEVYIIETEGGRFYTGITNNLDRRFSNHQKGAKGAKFFRLSRPKAIVFREEHPDRSAASKREASIKKMSRTQKIELILKTNFIS